MRFQVLIRLTKAPLFCLDDELDDEDAHRGEYLSDAEEEGDTENIGMFANCSMLAHELKYSQSG